MVDPQGAEDVTMDGQPAAYGNGTSGDGRIPGSEDILVNMGGQGQQNNHILLIKGSEKPEEFLARGRLTQQQTNDVMLMIADDNAVHRGFTDVIGLIGWKYNASIGWDGQGRKEFVQVEIHGRMANLRAGMGRAFDRFRNGAMNSG